MDKDFSTWWKAVREDVTNYLQAKANLTKIQAYEKVSKVTGVMASFLILALLAGFVIVFLLIMIGSWITALTHSNVTGYSSVALLILGLFLLLLFKRKSVLEKPIAEKVIEALYEEEQELRHHSANEKEDGGQ